MPVQKQPPLGGRGGGVQNRFPEVTGTTQRDPKSDEGVCKKYEEKKEEK